MSTVITEIMRFQEDRMLDIKPFSVKNESANILEELLELNGYDIPKDKRPELKEIFEDFKQVLVDNNVSTIKYEDINNNHSEIDALCDIVVFAIGAMMKLKYNPTKALEETAKEINSRKGTMVDGKFEKDLTAKTYKANYSLAKVLL